jgi:rRNA maturation endonuclease Nob1
MLNEFTEKVNKLTNKISNKAHDTLDVAKLQSAINKAKQDIDENYKELGKIYYENFALEENELFTEQIARIKENNAKVISLQEQIHQLKGTRVCDDCGKELKQDMSFCPYCGNKMKEEPVEEVHAEEVEEASEPITRETEVVEDEITPITEEL